MGQMVETVIGRMARADVDAGWDSESDEVLVVAAQGDRAEFAALYLRYVDPIYRFCYRRLGNRAAAEDATSRVFERAFTALPRFTTGSFRAWLFTIARNTVVDAYRANRGDRPLAEAWSIEDHRPGPEELSVDAADAAWIRGVLAQLSPDQRNIVELRLAGLTDVEIARSLDRSHGSVRSVQYRALQRLRALLGAGRSEHQGRKEKHHAPRQP